MTTFDLRSDASTHRVFVKVPSADVAAAMEDAARGLQAVMVLPPHPKGSVPLDIILSKFASQFRSGVTEKLVRKATGEAIYSLGLRSGADPQLDEEYRVTPAKRWLGAFADDGSLEFSVSWPRPPEVEIKNYIGIEVEVPEGDREAAIENQLQILRLQTSSNKLVERPATAEDVLVVDLVGADAAGNPLHGARFNDFVFRPKMRGGRGFSDKLDQLVVGRAAGESFSFEEKYPDNHPDKYLRSQEVVFTCTVREVRESVVPEIDDDFAKTAGYPDLAGLREAIGREWDAGNEASTEAAKRRTVRKKVVEANPLPVDEKTLLDNCRSAAEQLGAVFDDLLKAPETAEIAESIRADQREVIVYNEILDRIFDKHATELLLSESDILRYAGEEAQRGVTPEEELAAKRSKPAAYSAWLQRSQRQKVADWIVDKAVVTKVPEKES